MRRYLTILVLLRLVWGQEYDPQTGEVVKKQYNPETGQILKEQNNPNLLAEPSRPKFNSALKKISIKDLSKEQKKIYNRNKITIKVNGNMLFFNDFSWSGYIKKGFFKTKKLTQTEFFEITGYPERIEIARKNRFLMIKYALFYPILNLGFLFDDVIGAVIFLGGSLYIYLDYSSKIIDGTSFDDALMIANKYNQDLIVTIFNEDN